MKEDMEQREDNMPQYISNAGLWEPADLAAQEELKIRGVKTLGVKVKSKDVNNVAPNQSYPVMAEPQADLPVAGKDDKFPEIRKKGKPKEK